MAGTISSTDVHEIQRHDARDMKDMISNLPECILLKILSLLPTKDAVKTSILAKNWRHLWTYLSVFDFSIAEPLNESNHENRNSANCLLDLVGKLLHKSNRIERLSVEIFGNTVDVDKVSSLISCASKHKIQYLKFSLGDPNHEFVFPRCFSAFESLKELCLGLKFTLFIPSGICFPSLKTLVVSNVTFGDDESVHRLFSGCPVLQELTLDNCYSENIDSFRVEISTLKVLTIHFDPFQDNDYDTTTIVIDAVNLLSLSCNLVPKIEINPVNLTSVVDACIDLLNDYEYYEEHIGLIAIELLSGLGSVKSLSMPNKLLECLNYLQMTDDDDDDSVSLPTFHNLTHLYVFSGVPETTSVVLTDILRKAPKLEVLHTPSLVLEYLDGEYSIWNSVPCCVKSSLNQLYMLDFYGDEREIEFIRLLLKNATNLGVIHIFCSSELLADMEKVADVWNLLQPVNLGNCVIKFHYSYYESSDDSNDDSGADTHSSHIKEPGLEDMPRLPLIQHDEVVQLAYEVVSRFDAEKFIEFKTKFFKIVEDKINQLRKVGEERINQLLIPPPSYYQQQLLPPPYQQQPIQHPQQYYQQEMTNYSPNMNQLSLHHYYQSQLPLHTRVQSPGHPHFLPLTPSQPPFVTPDMSNHATFQPPKHLELDTCKIEEEINQYFKLGNIVLGGLEKMMNQ